MKTTRNFGKRLGQAACDVDAIEWEVSPVIGKTISRDVVRVELYDFDTSKRFVAELSLFEAVQIARDLERAMSTLVKMREVEQRAEHAREIAARDAKRRYEEAVDDDVRDEQLARAAAFEGGV